MVDPSCLALVGVQPASCAAQAEDNVCDMEQRTESRCHCRRVDGLESSREDDTTGYLCENEHIT